MLSPVPSNKNPDLAWLLKGLAQEVPAIRGSVLLSSDGLVKAAHGLDRDSSEYLAALASGLFSMARSASDKFDGASEVRQVVTELKSSRLFLAWAGHNSVIAVLAGGDADPGVVGFEMARLIKAVRPFLHTAPRPSATGSGDRNR
ncbi:roadblock/LC7 domain-containing protein [Nonomuraea mesophila]|uniref:Roadblock/LC7 domain-containing protein n=1 Tax=Nonomuraea mesophila TaxID=2530382 RepID=A0A4R5FMG3_9ACTN|nr:roadblock/LC7 domain-containing protein [Nonomuraea mesophila]